MNYADSALLEFSVIVEYVLEMHSLITSTDEVVVQLRICFLPKTQWHLFGK